MTRERTDGAGGWIPKGIIDTHVHTAPDVVPRSMTDVELAKAATDAGYRGVVLKSHHESTAGRAAVANEIIGGAAMFGGLALNVHATGGLNPYAVETAARLGAKVVWMPTFTAANQVSKLSDTHGAPLIRALGEVGRGIDILDEAGRPTEDTLRVVDAIAAHDLTLGTGHLSATEIVTLVPEALRRGVSRVIVNHPELNSIGLSIGDQITLARLEGIWFERVFTMTLPHIGYSPTLLAQAIRAVGCDTTIMATDLGQIGNPDPMEGMRAYITTMSAEGFGRDEIERMVCQAPAAALGLS